MPLEVAVFAIKMANQLLPRIIVIKKPQVLFNLISRPSNENLGAIEKKIFDFVFE